MVLPKGRGQVVFRMKEVELVSQLIDGTFPDYQQIIPRSYKSRTILSTPALLKACKQAEIFAREGSNVARLDIKSAGDLEPGSVEISAQSEETGSNETVVAATIDGVGLLDRLQRQIHARGAGGDQVAQCGAGDFCRRMPPAASARWAMITSCTSSCPCIWAENIVTGRGAASFTSGPSVPWRERPGQAGESWKGR